MDGRIRDDLLEHVTDVPKIITPGDEATMRCCVHKERAIVEKRVKLAMGGDRSNPNVIEVIEMACDECPVGGYKVTDVCRGCLAHRCEDVCKRGAITFDANHVAHIDKSKCIECGQCEAVCPSDVPIMLMNKKFIKDIDTLFGNYEAGLVTEGTTPLNSYQVADPEEFM